MRDQEQAWSWSATCLYVWHLLLGSQESSALRMHITTKLGSAQRLLIHRMEHILVQYSRVSTCQPLITNHMATFNQMDVCTLQLLPRVMVHHR